MSGRKAAMDYRFSIIPARAVTDPSLERGDVILLALLGRHTDRNGWCTRSQVTMAEELRCGRGTVQRSLDRLVEAGYVQKKANGRGRCEAPDLEEDERPFAAHSYRVLFDHDDAPDGGCPQAGTGGAHDERAGGAQPERARGAHMERAPLIEPSPLERSPSEPNARARAETPAKAKRKSPYTSGFERIWVEFLKWPDHNGAKWEAFQAYRALEDVRPGDGDLAVAVRAEARWLAETNRHRKANDPHPPPHPSTWLRRRGWERHLDAAALDAARDLPPVRITLACDHVEALRNAGLSEAVVATWFADGAYRPPAHGRGGGAFLAATAMKRDWIAQHYARELARAFGAGVTVSIKESMAA